MGAWLASGSHDLPPMMQQFVVLFSSYQLRPGNAYSLLIGALDKAEKVDDTSFASLNYECLLEWALMIHGRPVAYFGPQAGFTDVWKLHGSFNFLPGPGLDVAPAGTGVTFAGSGLKFNSGIEPVEPRSVPHRLRTTGLYPAIGLLRAGKRNPDFRAEHPDGAGDVRGRGVEGDVGRRDRRPAQHRRSSCVGRFRSLFQLGATYRHRVR